MIVHVEMQIEHLTRVQSYANLHEIDVDEALERLMRYAVLHFADPGHVYIARSGDRYKIGQSCDVKNRIKQIRPRAEVVMTLKSKNRRQLESILHCHFKEKRIEGEWFALDDADLARIRHSPSMGVLSYTVEQSEKAAA